MGNGTSQGVNGNTERPGALAPRFSTPRARAARRLPLAQVPHAANTWSRLQCGARAPEGGWRAPGAGRPLEGVQTAGQGGEDETVPCPGRTHAAAAAAAPALVLFWNLPHAEARGRSGEEGGGEQRPRAGHRRRHEEGAQPRLFPQPAGEGTQPGLAHFAVSAWPLPFPFHATRHPSPPSQPPP